jgi:hypothetical protein
MYWDNEPLYTLAMGPTLHVRIREDDFESSVRFILSNFREKVESNVAIFLAFARARRKQQ